MYKARRRSDYVISLILPLVWCSLIDEHTFIQNTSTTSRHIIMDISMISALNSLYYASDLMVFIVF